MTEIEKTIQEIENIDLKKDDAVDIINTLISTKLKRLPIFMTDLKVGEPLVRSRYLNDNEDFHYTVQDFSYHPKPEYIKIGRANLEGQQIFYGSRFRVTSLAEVRFVYANREKESSRYSLGRWEVKQKLQMAAIVTPESIRKHNTKELFGLADFIEQTEKESENDPELKGFIGLYKYLADKYTEPIQEGEEHKYKITSVFSNFIYSKLHIADGILYQSVQYPENFNVALKKEVIDNNKLQLTFAARQKYIRTEGLNYKEDESIQTKKIDYDSSIITW
jgi:RES domain